MDQSSKLRQGVWRAYSAVGEHPDGEHPFAIGRSFAERLGYPADALDRLPPESVAAITGVSTASVFTDIAPGARVLDVGRGAGLDTLIAAERAGR